MTSLIEKQNNVFMTSLIEKQNLNRSMWKFTLVIFNYLMIWWKPNVSNMDILFSVMMFIWYIDCMYISCISKFESQFLLVILSRFILLKDCNLIWYICGYYVDCISWFSRNIWLFDLILFSLLSLLVLYEYMREYIFWLIATLRWLCDPVFEQELIANTCNNHGLLTEVSKTLICQFQSFEKPGREHNVFKRPSKSFNSLLPSHAYI